MEINFNANSKLAKEITNKGQELVKKMELPEIITKSRAELTDMIERMVPENGKFYKVGVTFDIPNTFNEAILTVMHDAENPKNLRQLNVGIHHRNSDKLFSMYTQKGTNGDILNYLKQPNCESDILKQIKDLSKTMEDHYSSL